MHRKPIRRSTETVFTEPQRLHKVLAQCGYGSLRGLEELIIAGRITVNRQPAEVGQKVGPNDQIRINGELVRLRFAPPRMRVLLYHKPAGEIVSRADPEGRPTVFDKLPRLGSAKWIAVGRLDFNSEGLLLFTTSGELANRLMHPRYEVEREYSVRVMGTLTPEQERSLLEGVPLDDGMARVTSLSDAGGEGANHWYKLTLPEGRNREVRRLFEALGLMVSRLIRIRYGVIAMPPQLKRGQTVELEHEGLAHLLQATGLTPGGTDRDRASSSGDALGDGEQEAEDANGNGIDASAQIEESDEDIDEVDGNRAPPPPQQQPRGPRPQAQQAQPARQGPRGNRGRNRGGSGGGGGNRGGNGGGNAGNGGGNRGGGGGGNRGGGGGNRGGGGGRGGSHGGFHGGNDSGGR
jgi:23S rRNA pseudouridine2605 synthase